MTVRRLAHRMGYRFRLCIAKTCLAIRISCFQDCVKLFSCMDASGTGMIARAGRASQSEIAITGSKKIAAIACAIENNLEKLDG